MRKVCFAASTGGHLEELLMLKPLMEKYDSFILTEKTNYTAKVDDIEIHYVMQINRREKLFPLKLIGNTFLSLGIFLRKRPDAVVCLGVLATIPMCLLCKLLGRKLIYIESFAKVTSPTITGKLLYRFADKFYVQWEPMLEVYPKATYLGGIF